MKTEYIIIGAAALVGLFTVMNRKKTSADLVDTGTVYEPGVSGTTDLNVGQTITALTELVQTVGAPFVLGTSYAQHPAGYLYSDFDKAWIRPDLYGGDTPQMIFTDYNSSAGGAWSGWVGGHRVG